jgi:hypothetical protein
MKNYLVLITATLLLSVQANAETILKCAVKNVRNEGARVNLLQSAGGNLRANLLFGATVSGTMYNVVEVKPGVYQGTIKGKEEFKLELTVSEVAAENRYIRGFKSSLSVEYPDLRKRSGRDSFTSTAGDEFVCGRQIRGFGE